MTGIPFIGEQGFYPTWARGKGRWVFQRTLVSVGGIMAGYAELAAANVPSATQIIVWVPKHRGLLGRVFKSSIHEERELALQQLRLLRHICYGGECKFELDLGSDTRVMVRETGLYPEEWYLICPACGGNVGPDLAPIRSAQIIMRWGNCNRPVLEYPGASAAFRSAPPITDLPEWILKNEPSHLELAYLGQQMWTHIDEMFKEISG